LFVAAVADSVAVSDAVELAAAATIGSLSWSPDGRHITYTIREDGKAGLFVATPDGAKKVPVTASLWMSEDWVWAPEGGRIAFLEIPADADLNSGDLQDYTVDLIAVTIAGPNREVVATDFPAPPGYCSLNLSSWTAAGIKLEKEQPDRC